MSRNRTCDGQQSPTSARASRRRAARDASRSSGPTSRRRDRRRLWGGRATIAAAGLALIAFALVVTLSSGGGALPGLQTGAPPWSANSAQLRARLAAIGLAPQTMEGQVLHTHEHLDLFVDGRPVTVPADIGINAEQGFLAPLHTHDETGLIHVESPVVATFTVGQFFDVWGVALTPSCLGGACQPAGQAVAAFVNGQAWAGDPRNIALVAHDEICLCVGALPSRIPATYAFPAGL